MKVCGEVPAKIKLPTCEPVLPESVLVPVDVVIVPLLVLVKLPVTVKLAVQAPNVALLSVELSELIFSVLAPACLKLPTVRLEVTDGPDVYKLPYNTSNSPLFSTRESVTVQFILPLPIATRQLVTYIFPVTDTLVTAEEPKAKTLPPEPPKEIE